MPTKQLLLTLTALIIFTGLLWSVEPLPLTVSQTDLPPTSQVTATGALDQASTTPAIVQTDTEVKEVATSSSEIALNGAVKSPSPSAPQAERLPSPYTTPPLPFSEINVLARSALVNIFCISRGNTLRPISGSGVMIDGRGVILTNAHVAQYVLLSEVPQLDISCTIRTGSPAAGSWSPAVLYMPEAWVRAHASELKLEHPLGTGEHDYALLYLTGTVDGSPLPSSFPAVEPDARQGAGFTGDSVLVASYPAEFLGASATTHLAAASTITSIGQLLTFATSSVDAISVGGVIEAQSGSSGGVIVNAWGRLIGVITTTSVGATTAERDLRAITLSYVDRDLYAQTGEHLSGLLSGDLRKQLSAFSRTEAVQLAQLLVDQLSQ